MTYTEYIMLPKKEQIVFKVKDFFRNFGRNFVNFFIGLYRSIINFFKGLGRSFKEVGYAFSHGNIWTKLSFLFLGAGHFASGQRIKGTIIFLVEVLFIFYMIMTGGSAIRGFFTLGNVESYFSCNYQPAGSTDFILDEMDFRFLDQATASTYCSAAHPGLMTDTMRVWKDNSSIFLLFGVLAILILIGFVFFYINTIKTTITLQEKKYAKLHINTFVEDLKDYLDGKFYRVLLFLPIVGIMTLTILPLITMILMAFTNYNAAHVYPKFFSWVAFDNFITLFGGGIGEGARFSKTFMNVFIWTITWAVFATFLNYFLGMFVAMVINRKGVKGKKIFRSLLVLSIAMPQFVSLLSFREFFATDGLMQGILQAIGIFGPNEKIRVLSGVTSARIFVILVNIWVGIPYTMLAVTGVLINIPEDLYESAQIDGASPIKTYAKITLPYVLFVTGPKLITDFVGNINNFNVIFMLTGGAPMTNDYLNAGHTDLLVTWLYRLTTELSNYAYASVIGIMVFVISAVFSLIAYRHTAGFKNEEDFA